MATPGMLAKEPAQRPTMHQVEEQLTLIEQQLLAGTSRSAGAGRQRARLLRWGSGLLLLSVAAGTWQLSRTRAMTRRAGSSAALGQTVQNTASPREIARPLPAPATAPAPTVQWDVRSVPAGARIVRLADQVLLGTTPWQSQEAKGDAEVAVSIELPGYVPQRALLSHQKDAKWDLPLQPLAASVPADDRTLRARARSGGHPHAEPVAAPAAPPVAAAQTPAVTAAPPPPPAAGPEPAPPAPVPTKKPLPPRQEDTDVDVPALH